METPGFHIVNYDAPRVLPHSTEAESKLLACCMLDGNSVISECLQSRLTGESFYLASHGVVFDVIADLFKRNYPVDCAVVCEELAQTNWLEQAGGINAVIAIGGQSETSLQASYFIRTVRDLAIRREIVRKANEAIELAHSETDAEKVVAEARTLVGSVEVAGAVKRGRAPSSYLVPPDDDDSILLGDRFLNRGDGGIIASTSGVGKSSISIQKAYCWALGRDAFGIRARGPLKSLMIQAEDSDGDIAEVRVSVEHGLKLTESEKQQVDKNVIIITERVRRGAAFIAELRRLVKEYKPDLVWINPLVAFIEGDIKDSKDVGTFLREGLNSLNEPATFGYIIIHHTTKPPTDKGKTERSWNEVMYDMAGSYDLTGWARFVISLRATETPHEFKLVVAKRGFKAGITKQVPQGAGFRTELVTEVGIKHSKGTIPIAGRAKPMQMIFWEANELAESAKPVENANGYANPAKPVLAPFRQSIPLGVENAASLAELTRVFRGIKPIKANLIAELLIESADDGLIQRVYVDSQPRYYR